MHPEIHLLCSYPKNKASGWKHGWGKLLSMCLVATCPLQESASGHHYKLGVQLDWPLAWPLITTFMLLCFAYHLASGLGFQISNDLCHISKSTWWVELSVREGWFWAVYRNLSSLHRLNTFFFCFPAYVETRCEVAFPCCSFTIRVMGPLLSLSPVSLFWHIRNH